MSYNLQKGIHLPTNGFLFQVNKFPHTVGGLEHETISILLLVHIVSQLIQFQYTWKNTLWLHWKAAVHLYVIYFSLQIASSLRLSTDITMAQLQIYELTTNIF